MAKSAATCQAERVVSAVASDARDGGAGIEHLARCGGCAAELREPAEAIDAAAGWDVGLAKAASARLAAPTTVTTSCGRYTIALHPRPDADEAVVTVEVAPQIRDALEGTVVTVCDRGGRELLRAPVVLGRASARLRGLAGIDCTRIVVRTARTEEA
jgi:hypothetical protein